MIGIIIAAALVTQTYGGNMSVVPGLTDHDCAEAASLALYGRTIEQKAADDAKAAAAEAVAQRAKDAAAQTEWEAKHPKRAAACRAINEVQSGSFVIANGGDCGPELGRWNSLPTIWYGSSSSVDTYAIKLAECVK